ncbi:UDP-N-acetylmuramate--L-alanine ligase [Suttonella sp. R2A3]|uniref:UDP-N-acetylmuramate--L-alanine ligase n=1 Tax=Suttonella sp. R2A3 TaxID=2908648 RepID=UPI001F18F613|nr:UDP-N-acetylmuramate--L-alanine ligase [Suttonella sp. R2A3]UJF24615.1 UDP-N-acetylmuramate--L-alanine ligase [Suttonella sp. R2A3]
MTVHAADIHFGRIEKRQMRRIKEVFFVGIGGVGMSAIAEVLINLGYQVSGSDLNPSANTDRLKAKGATLYFGHDAQNVAQASVVVTSSAINPANPEVAEARRLGIPVIRRAEMLAELMRFRFGIAVAGTHGKTTTTSLTASILADAGLDPTFVIGGVLTSVGSNARLGEGQYLVAEADESDTSFLFLQPMISIVTNIDADHLENYGGSYENLKEGFIQFLHNLPFYGLAVVCVDDPGVQAILPEIARPIRTYGFSDQAEIQARNVRQDGLVMRFDVYDRQRDQEWPMALNMPGKHNVLNALAALIVAEELGLDHTAITEGLAQFRGVGRRFTHHGVVSHARGQADVFEDYGHHPSEISAVLEAAAEGFAGRRVVAVFQPHRYTRTRDLLDDFAEVLSRCDTLVLTEVYSAGETPIAGADSRDLARAIRGHGRVEPILIAEKNALNQRLREDLLHDDDVVIYFGAGDIGRQAKAMTEDA